MLACWSCRNLDAFVQVSERGDNRVVQQRPNGLSADPWSGEDPRAPGLYCRSCGESVDGDADLLGLLDTRVEFVSPSEFDADSLARELTELRPDAAWSRLELPAQAAQYQALQRALHPAVDDSLARTGRERLYVHQAMAIDLALDGRSVIQATPAGSGKSLGLTIPVLDGLMRSSQATALIMYPLKALANDQLKSLARLGLVEDPWLDTSSFDLQLDPALSPIRVGRYDGDTMEHEKRAIRRDARLVIATPDMLHASILRMGSRTYRDGTSWSRFLKHLQFIVLDEMHSYQGVFGSAVANVLRRLRRLRSAAGGPGEPQFLMASATIGNPIQLAQRLTGTEQFDLVERDGSERRRRVVLICNPPERVATRRDASPEGAAEDDLGRIAPQTVAIDLMAQAALASDAHLPVRTIAFCQSRNAVFQLSKRLQGALKELHHSELSEHVAPYAATFLADDRSEQEGRLRDGSTLAIVSTSALELGIDIPELSLAVLVGYPGQVSSFRQRAGRVGRSGEGLAALIVGDDPLQQYLARDPQALAQLLDAHAEDIIVNPEAPEIVKRYGLAPAQEELGGIAYSDASYFGAVAVDTWLADATGAPSANVLGEPGWAVDHDVDDAYANLRSSVAGRRFTVMAGVRADRRPIGVIDGASAPRDAFDGAIWTGPDGLLYRVVGHEQDLAEIFCEGPVEVPYQTRGVAVDRVEVLNHHRPPSARAATEVSYGQLRITRQVFSYKEQHFSGVEHTRHIARPWPPLDFLTDGLHIDLRRAPLLAHDPERDGAVRAVEHAILGAAPALVASDPHDIDASSDRNGIFVYDSFGGGLRLTEALFERYEELINLAYEIVSTCPCLAGCPSCVYLSRRPDGNADLSKEGAISLLRLLAGEV